LPHITTENDLEQQELFLRDFSWQWISTLQSSWMWCHMVLNTSGNTLCLLSLHKYHEVWVTRLLWTAGTYLPDYL